MDGNLTMMEQYMARSEDEFNEMYDHYLFSQYAPLQLLLLTF